MFLYIEMYKYEAANCPTWQNKFAWGYRIVSYPGKSRKLLVWLAVNIPYPLFMHLAPCPSLLMTSSERGLNTFASISCKNTRRNIPDERKFPQPEAEISIIYIRLLFQVLYMLNIMLCITFSDNATPDQMNDFLDEINLMKAVGSHKNIVSLIGCCTCIKFSPNFLVVEFASEGDLLSYLRERRKKVKAAAVLSVIDRNHAYAYPGIVLTD